MAISTLKKAQKYVHYYAQSSGFTCGPTSLMMVLRKYNAHIKICRETEYQIWRESNTLYMGNSHPGANPYGLALSAKRLESKRRENIVFQGVDSQRSFGVFR